MIGKCSRKSLFEFAQHKDLSLRELERVAAQLALVAAAVTKNHLFFAPLVVGLSVMRLRDRKLYEEARRDHITWEQASNFLFGRSNTENPRDDIIIDLWKFVTGQECTRSEAIQKHLLNFNFGGNKHPGAGLLPLMADYMERLEFNE